MPEKKNNAPAVSDPELNPGPADEKEPAASIAYALGRLGSKDITPSPAIDPAAEAAKKRGTVYRLCALAVCVVVFAWSCVSIVTTLSGYREAQDFYDELAQDVMGVGETSPSDAPTPPFGKRDTAGESNLSNAMYERMKTRLAALAEVNPDVCGWINVPGTKHINYPILQAKDNEYYLDREYTGGYLAAGSIFLDYRCSRDFNENHNTVIYGHNMQNGMMFSELINFLDGDFFANNKYVYIYTQFGVYTYEVFAVFKADYRYKYNDTDFASHAEFVEFANEMRDNSVYKREGIVFDENSRIITLSTCTNGLWTDRYSVQAVLIDAYND